MRKRFFFTDHDGRSTYKSPTEFGLRHSCGDHLLCQITSLVDSSLHHSKYLSSTGTLVIREALDCIFKFTGALVFPFASGAKSKPHHNLSGDHGSKNNNRQSCLHGKRIFPSNLMAFNFGFESRSESDPFVILSKFLVSTIRCLQSEARQLPLFPVLSLAAALIPPFDNLRSKEALASPLNNTDVQIKGGMAQAPCLCERRRCADISFSEINWTDHAFEPKTGIKFPAVLDNFLAERKKFNPTSELLVGTGCRSMKILRIKSLDVYAFGLYVHPDSVCEKLGPKYASVSPSELNNQPEFFEDLLREDINMTVRLVVNCSGLKVNTVRDIFERSLRTRLLKMNPNTDYHCVSAFGSYFTRDISFPVGTIVDFRQTAEGKLITEIGGKQIGAVHSKDLCRAFFDMYIGDVSVPSYAKEEIAKNVASIIKRCN